MGVGIGLGAFMEGIGNGINLAQQYKRAKYQNAQIDREQANQEDMDKLNAAASADAQANVDAGKIKPEDVPKFVTQYWGPKKVALLAQQGKYSEAKDLRDWAESDATKEGSRLFGQALFHAQAGDLEGAVDTAVKAGQVNGYLDHDLEFTGKEPIKSEDGSIAGYRVTLKQGDGKQLVWDVNKDNVESGIAQLLNPEAAYNTRLAAKAAREKAALEVETFGAKEGIKDKYESARDAKKHAYDVDLTKLKKSLGGEGAPPADIASAEQLAKWTAAAGGREPTDQDKLDAYKQIKQAKDNPNGRAALVVRVYEGMKQDLRDKATDEDKRAAARQYVDDLFAEDKAAAPENAPAGPQQPVGIGLGNGGAGAPAAKPTAKNGAKPKAAPKSMPIPAELKGEPDGTVVKDDEGNQYTLQGGQLIPVGK